MLFVQSSFNNNFDVIRCVDFGEISDLIGGVGFFVLSILYYSWSRDDFVSVLGIRVHPN